MSINSILDLIRYRVGHYNDVLVSIGSFSTSFDVLESSINTIWPHNRQNCLHYAIVRNSGVGVIRKSLELGANRLAKDTKSKLPLHYAVEYYDIQSVEALLAQYSEAQLNAVDIYGNTPLMIALSKGYFNILRLLVSKGANFDFNYLNGWTALHEVSKNAISRSSINLVAKHISIYHRCQKNETALHVAVNAKRLVNVQALLDRHQQYQRVVNNRPDDYIADYINIQNTQGLTALHHAASQGSKNVAEYLINNGADFHVRTVDGQTAIGKALQGKHAETVAFLTQVKQRVGYLYPKPINTVSNKIGNFVSGPNRTIPGTFFVNTQGRYLLSWAKHELEKALDRYTLEFNTEKTRAKKVSEKKSYKKRAASENRLRDLSDFYGILGRARDTETLLDAFDIRLKRVITGRSGRSQLKDNIVKVIKAIEKMRANLPEASLYPITAPQTLGVQSDAVPSSTAANEEGSVTKNLSTEEPPAYEADGHSPLGAGVGF